MTQLATKNFQLSINGIRHNVFRVTPELDTPLDATLVPGYWAHVSAMLRIGDRIEVLAEDGSYFSELLVRDVGNLYAKVSVLSHTKFEQEVVEVPEGYDVKWRGPSAKYGVLRGKDVLKDGFVGKAEANAWLTDLIKKVA